ncbi:MAG: DNA-3-methyladenine glycosylase I [Phycisphaerales bacterium]
MPRCPWALSELSKAYHDREWGVPVHDDRVFFEFLVLEGAQAGLSWETILRKRERYRAVYDGFDPRIVARYDRRKMAALLADQPRARELAQFPGGPIVRNRLKIESSVSNAKAFLLIQDEFGSFDAYVWRFVGGSPLVHRRRSMSEVPASTAESDALSKDLSKRGFRFVGTTIMYAFMQATGLVNDHLASCPRGRAVRGARTRAATS